MEGLLMEVCNNEELVCLESIEDKHHPTPSRIDLKTIDDVRLEMARCYRDMRANKIQPTDGTRLVYVLAQIGKMIELHDIEERVERLEAKNEPRK
jgi:hypothetical protein